MNLPKSHEGLHLVRGAADVLGPLQRIGHVAVGDHFDQIRLVPEPPQQPIHQIEPIFGAVQDDVFRQFDKGFWHSELGLNRRAYVVGVGGAVEQPALPGPARHLETRRSRLHARQSECARRLAPAVEIRLAIQRRDRHQNRLNCSGARPPTCVFRSAASVRAPGVQSSAVMKGRTLATERVSRPTSSSRSVR